MFANRSILVALPLINVALVRATRPICKRGSLSLAGGWPAAYEAMISKRKVEGALFFPNIYLRRRAVLAA